MNQQTLYIAFGDHQVAVHSCAPDVLAGTKRNFRHMIELEPKKVIRQLEVCCKNGEYHLIRDEASGQNKTLTDDILLRIKYEVVMALIRHAPIYCGSTLGLPPTKVVLLCSQLLGDGAKVLW